MCELTVMRSEIVRLSVLTFMAGAACKLYDDLVDNQLYTPYVDYITEFLKGMHYILLTYVSAEYIYPAVLSVLINGPMFIFDRSAFGTYETAGIAAFALWSCYLVVSNLARLNSAIFMFVASYMLLSYFFEVCLCKNVEYGYKKLCIRGLSAIVTASVLMANLYVQYVPDEHLYCLWYIVGYCTVSTVFQTYLMSTAKDCNMEAQLINSKMETRQVINSKMETRQVINSKMEAQLINSKMETRQVINSKINA